jgi:hypothetical protein
VDRRLATFRRGNLFLWACRVNDQSAREVSSAADEFPANGVSTNSETWRPVAENRRVSLGDSLFSKRRLLLVIESSRETKGWDQKIRPQCIATATVL